MKNELANNQKKGILALKEELKGLVEIYKEYYNKETIKTERQYLFGRMLSYMDIVNKLEENY